MQKGKGEIKGEKKKKMTQKQINISKYPAHLKDARVEFMGEVALGAQRCTECSDVITEVTEFCCGPGNLCTLTALRCGEPWAVQRVL